MAPANPTRLRATPHEDMLDQVHGPLTIHYPFPLAYCAAGGRLAEMVTGRRKGPHAPGQGCAPVASRIHKYRKWRVAWVWEASRFASRRRYYEKTGDFAGTGWVVPRRSAMPAQANAKNGHRGGCPGGFKPATPPGRTRRFGGGDRSTDNGGAMRPCARSRSRCGGGPRELRSPERPREGAIGSDWSRMAVLQSSLCSDAMTPRGTFRRT